MLIWFSTNQKPKHHQDLMRVGGAGKLESGININHLLKCKQCSFGFPPKVGCHCCNPFLVASQKPSFPLLPGLWWCWKRMRQLCSGTCAAKYSITLMRTSPKTLANQAVLLQQSKLQSPGGRSQGPSVRSTCPFF